MFKKLMIFLAFAGSVFAGDYVVDVPHSSLNFSVKHMMISNVKGNFTKFSGDFGFDEKQNTITKLQGTAEANSINTGIEKRDAHLKGSDFFDTSKYKTLKFVMTKFIAGQTPKVEGDLTIKGVTKKVIFDADIGGYSKNGKIEKVGFSLSGVINRKDFGLDWNKSIDTGGVVVGEDVKITIDIEGNKIK